MIDSHAHIYAAEFDGDRSQAIERASEYGVQRIYMPNVDHVSIDLMLETEARHPEICKPMMGLHPCYVKKGFERDLYLVEDWLKKRSFAAVGEIGIDLYWDTQFRALQEEAFKIQVKLAHQFNLPVVIHCRNSFRETMDLLKEVKSEGQTGIFHCFSGTVEDAREVVDAGFFLGIGGVVTFKNGGLDKVLPEIALDYMMLETDSPYLAPVPHRGKRNEPAYLNLVAEKIAHLKNKSVEEVKEITTGNALKLF